MAVDAAVGSGGGCVVPIFEVVLRYIQRWRLEDGVFIWCRHLCHPVATSERFLYSGRRHCLHVPQRAPHPNHTSHSTLRLCDLGDLAIRTISISDPELGNRPHFPRDPASEDLAALFFVQAGAGEIAFGDKGNNVDDKLVFVEHGIDDDRDDGGEIGFSAYFDQDDYETASLEDGTEEKWLGSDLTDSLGDKS